MGKSSILLRDAVKEYREYKKKQRIHAQDLMQMDLYFDMLLENLESSRAYDLTKKADKDELREYAIAMVTLPKKECGDLKASDVQRAKFFNGFVDYVTDATVFKKGKVRLEKIPFVMNELERKIDIVKNYRHLQNMTQEQIGDLYYVGDKTIRNDLREIREGYLNAFGQKIDIGYDLETKDLFSTPVPLFLVQNITQVVALLNGLKLMHDDPRYCCYAEASAVNIWRQLARPVRERISKELVELLQLDVEWYGLLDEKMDSYKEAYYHERNISQNQGNAMLFLKNGLPCKVIYHQDDHIKTSEISKIISCEPEWVQLEDGTQISYENIVDIIETGN